MRIGDAVPAKSIRVMVPNGWLNYKAPEGEYFVFILLGTQPIKGPPLQPDAALADLGWQFIETATPPQQSGDSK